MRWLIQRVTNLPSLFAAWPGLQAVLAHAASLPGLASVRSWVLAGHSMGARVACTVAEQQQEVEQDRLQEAPGLPPVAAVMLFSYPLHPPGKPDQLRDALLTRLQLPALLVRGTRDPFSQQALWDATLARLGCPRWEQHVVQGGDHALRCGAAGGGSDAAMGAVADSVRRFLLDIAAAAGEQQAKRGQNARRHENAQPAVPEGSSPAGPQKWRRTEQETRTGKRGSTAAQQQQQPGRAARGKRKEPAADAGETGRQPAAGSDAVPRSSRRRK